MRALNPRLRIVPLNFSLRERLTYRDEMSFDATRALGGGGKFPAQALQAVLALDDAGVRVGAARHTQPVTAHPFAAPRHDRPAGLQGRSPRQRIGERL